MYALRSRFGQNTLQKYLNSNRKYCGYKAFIYKYGIISGKYEMQIL